MKRNKLTGKTYHNPYDLSQLGMGLNQPCPRCGLEIDRRSSPYEPIGFKKFCSCND
jgi:hypothetical protein